MILLAIAKVYLMEGDDKYRDKQPHNAIHFYSEGLQVNCSVTNVQQANWTEMNWTEMNWTVLFCVIIYYRLNSIIVSLFILLIIYQSVFDRVISRLSCLKPVAYIISVVSHIGVSE